MRLDHLQYHLNRRQLLGGAAKLGAVGAVASATGGLLAGVAGASTTTATRAKAPGSACDPGDYDDSFSIEGALNGEWAAATAARYGAEDERGTLNEITPTTTAAALGLLAGASTVTTHNMGHLMVNGFPAFVAYPPRKYQQRLFGYGFTPNGSDYFTTTTRGDAGEDEWRQADRERGPLWYWGGQGAIGPNQVSSFEERFPEGGTYQIATQLDNLNHVGVGDVYYNGFLASEFAAPTGTTKLGMEHVGPFVTRGVLIDVLGWKQDTGGNDVDTVGGNAFLTDNYRITLEDLLETMAWEGVEGIGAGDAVVIRTGWHKLAEDPATYDRYLAAEPGIYVREAKYLADHRPVVVASDTFGLEVLGNTDLPGDAFPVHQWLLTREGVRIGEGVISDGLAEAGSYEFVYSYSPQYALGATAGNVPPMGLAPGH